MILNKITHAFFDFDGCFTDNSIYIGNNGSEFVKCCRGDGIGIEMLKKSGVYVEIITSEKCNIPAMLRAEKLGIEITHGCKDKKKYLEDNYDEHLENAMFMGNDINDLGAMLSVQTPVASKDAVYEVLLIANLITVLHGGYGAVREACEWIIKYNNDKTRRQK